METKVKILKNDRVHIIIKGFEAIPYHNIKLTLILRHIARFDIKDKKLMCLDGDIRVDKLKIVSNKFGSHNSFIEMFKIAAGSSLWKPESKILVESVQLLNGDNPEIEIIYGYNK